MTMPTARPHEGRVAIVTGAGKGIGREVALRLAERGASLVLIGASGCADTTAHIRETGGLALDLRGDVASEADWGHAADAVRARFGRADILVNNAGISPHVDFLDMDYAQWTQVMRVNLDGAFLGARAFAPMMKAGGWGRIVNVSSCAIGTENSGMSHYIASKMGVIGLTRGLANDLGRYGITVNAVAPGVTNTPQNAVIPPEILEAIWRRQPIARYGEPADIAGPILFLTSDDASFITGQTLMADGGMVKL